MEIVVAAGVTGFFSVVAILVKQNFRGRRVEQGVDDINKAVNSKPSDQPSLYDMVATMDLKVEGGFKTMHRRIDALHERIDKLTDRRRN